MLGNSFKPLVDRSHRNISAGAQSSLAEMKDTKSMDSKSVEITLNSTTAKEPPDTHERSAPLQDPLPASTPSKKHDQSLFNIEHEASFHDSNAGPSSDVSSDQGHDDSPVGMAKKTSALPSPVPSHFILPLGDGYEAGLDKVGKLFRQGTIIGLAIWVVLLFVIFRYAPANTFEQPQGIEQNVHLTSLILLVVTNGSRIAPLALRENNLAFLQSGVLIGTFAVQFIAVASNFILAFYPTPVLEDKISGLRFHLVRWAEWIPLAFLMTFLTGNVDAPLRAGQPNQVTYRIPICLALSTAAGLLFPFCGDFVLWMANLIVSWVLFVAIYALLYKRAMQYYKIQTGRPSLGNGPEESYELVRSSYTLSLVCSVTWTLLALSFTLVCLGPSYAPKGSILAHPAAPVVCTGCFEIASKIWYLSALIEAYDKIFDEKARALRRLEQLRHFMSAVWESSSDVIAFCVEQNHRVSTRISPAFLKMLGLSTGRLPFLHRGDVSLVMEILPLEGVFYIFAMDLSKPVTLEDVSRLKEASKCEKRNLVGGSKMSVEDYNLATMAQLALRACRMKVDQGNEISLMQDFLASNVEGAEQKMRCEAKISKLEGRSCVLVLRDISDRIQRFEAEKKLVREVTIRRKDAEANRFARHEVKNGILAAIGLLDHIRENIEKKSGTGDAGQHFWRDGSMRAKSASLHSIMVEDSIGPTVNEQELLGELDSTLRDILDRILDEAMAREIIYREYQPRRERMDVPDVLDSLRRRSSHRFPLRVLPHPFPQVNLDRQLLRYIYRNAVSNACKYGQCDGVVETVVTFDQIKSTFIMEVINLPGVGHAELLKLSEQEVATVFSPGTQLAATSTVAEGNQAQIVRNESSGNGAWIMQKCAEALGGRCEIRFESTRTVFSFVCPVTATSSGASKARSDEAGDDSFELPDGTWGIAVDDSAIQRKILDRFLRSIGIDRTKSRILGANSEELYGFGEIVTSLMEKHPNDKFLLIVDENLDVEDGGATHQTISGSRSVEGLLSSLNAADESRLLALIRSANDSSTDLDLYKTRAHGYLLKEPIKKGRISDVIKPWWLARFPLQTNQSKADARARDENESYGASSDDIRQELVLMDALSGVKDESILRIRWLPIREKLFRMKGDLKTLNFTRKSLADEIEIIDDLIKYDTLPPEFSASWWRARTGIEAKI